MSNQFCKELKSIKGMTAGEVIGLAQLVDLLRPSCKSEEELTQQAGYTKATIAKALEFRKLCDAYSEHSKVFTWIETYFRDLPYLYLQSISSFDNLFDVDSKTGGFFPKTKQSLLNSKDLKAFVRCHHYSNRAACQWVAVLYYFKLEVSKTVTSYAEVRETIRDIFMQKRPTRTTCNNPWVVKALIFFESLESQFDNILPNDKFRLEQKQLSWKAGERWIQEMSMKAAESTRKAITEVPRRDAFLQRLEEQQKESEARKQLEEQERRNREREEQEAARKAEAVRLASIVNLTPVDLEYQKLGFVKCVQSKTSAEYRNPASGHSIKLDLMPAGDVDSVSKIIYYQTLRYAKILESRDGGSLTRQSKKLIISELFRLIKLVWNLKPKKGH